MKQTFKKKISATILITTIFSTNYFYTTENNNKPIIISTNTSDLVDISTINPNIKKDIYYATTNNFTGQILYKSAKCYLRKTTAEKLNKVQKILEEKGLGLKVWDGYRPLSAQKKMWKIVPDPQFVADPSKGSMHNRGAAVDVTLVDLKTGKELEMPTGFDDFSANAAAYCTEGISKEAINNRTILQDAMTKCGFLIFKSEWWHFNDSDWKQYAILDVDFSEISK